MLTRETVGSLESPPQMKTEKGNERLESSRLKEPRQLYSAASLLHPPKWPIECQVILDKIEHVNIAPWVSEPFYTTTNSEPQPPPVGEEMGTVIYQYNPKLCVDYYCRSRVGGSEELTVFETDETTLEFESRFESGNLAKVIKITNVYYELYLRTDMYTDRHAQWYYFRIGNTRENIVYRFSIVNLSKPDSLYRYGMKPLVYSEKDVQTNGIGWVRSGTNISYFKNDITATDNSSSFTLTFNLKFHHSGDTVYIAQCYPYTYSNLQSYLQDIQSDRNKAHLCQQRLLCKSLAGNNVYVLTITAPDDQAEEDQVKKPAVVLTARVHPGETPSSYMMKGIIDFLISDCLHAQELRERFIFKLIPMLNPDGVIVGNSRCCLLGQDLNRQYRTVLREAFPQIYQTKVLLRRLVDENGIFLYCDIHGHSRRNNVFMYGCENRRIPEKKLTEQVFPFMMRQNVADKFSFSNCKFRIQKSKEGTGRIFVWTLGVGNSYTLEISLGGSTLVSSREHTHFNFMDYEDLGQQFCETLLEYSDTSALKGKIRRKILQKLIQGGSTADDPKNIPISDYSNLSLSESDDESETTEDDDEPDLQEVRQTYRRNTKGVRKSKINKQNMEERKPMKLSTPMVEEIRFRKKEKKNDLRTSMESFCDTEDGKTFRNLTFTPRTMLKLSPVGKAQLMSLYRKQNNSSISYSTVTTRYTNLLFDNPFQASDIVVAGKDEQEETLDTGTQTEDECDYTDATMKNEFYLPSKSSSTTLITRFKSLSLLSNPKRNKTLYKNKSGTTVAKTKELEFISEKFNSDKNVVKCDNSENHRRGSVVNLKKVVRIKHSVSQEDMKEKPHKLASSASLSSTITTNSQKSSNFLQIPKFTKPLTQMSRRRVSWGGSEGSIVTLTSPITTTKIGMTTHMNSVMKKSKSFSSEEKRQSFSSSVNFSCKADKFMENKRETKKLEKKKLFKFKPTKKT